MEKTTRMMGKTGRILLLMNRGCSCFGQGEWTDLYFGVTSIQPESKDWKKGGMFEGGEQRIKIAGRGHGVWR